MSKNLEWCCKKQIKPLYDNIKYKDYFEPIKKFSEENNNTFELVIKNKKIDDIVMQYYIKASTNISIVVIYPSALKHEKLIDKMITKLEQNGDIHYSKDIELDYYMAYNLIFQLYASEKRMKSNSDIVYKINRLGFKLDNINKIKVIIYTLKNTEKQINGKSAEFKMELRDIFVQEDIKTSPYKETNDMYPRGYDYLHVSDDNNQSYEYAGLFLHENSINFLKKQKTWRILEMEQTQKLINKMKSFMYDYSQKELEKLMIFSSGVLFAYGIREANDLDCILLECENIKPELIEELNKQDMDISYKGTKEWVDGWVDQLNNRAIIFGAKNYHDLIINPKFYFYFMGLKIIRLKCDLMIRFKRGRPAQMTDLIVIRQMFNLGYKLKIPETTTKYSEKEGKDIITQVNKNKYLETIQYYLKTRYYIYLNIEQIEQWLNQDFIEKINNDNDEYYTDLTIDSKLYGGFSKEDIESINSDTIIKPEKINLDIFDTIDNVADNKFIYPTQEELIKMGFAPKIIIYSSDKPYIYPGEDFSKFSNANFCNREITEIKLKNTALRIATFNVHNFITRCNQGLAPIFGTALNPFEKPRDIKKWLDLFGKINADVLCLQELVPITNHEIKENITDLIEIRNSFNFHYFNEQMELIGYKYRIIGSTMQGNFYDNEKRDYYYLSNGIYSKIKLENAEIYQYKYLNRNIITASIKYKNHDIQIFNTHLEYYRGENKILNELKKNSNQVDEQFKNLNELINSFTDKTDNIILCGDLNINVFNLNEINKANLRYKNWDSNTRSIRNNFNNSNYKVIPTNFSQNDQTDFIFYHKNSKIKNVYARVIFTNISDHYMILSDFI